jgi:predicted flap endonuclease-1-like 5' DNA nuclease
MLCRFWRCALCGVAGKTSREDEATAGNQGDDLTVIRGIGIVSQDQLYKAGIKTYAALAGTPAEEVRRLLGNLARGVQVEEWIAEARELAGKDTS